MTDAITGTFVRVKTMTSGIRLEIDLQCSMIDIAPLAVDGQTFAIVGLTKEAAKEDAIQQALKGGPISKNAAQLCRDGQFIIYCTSKYQDDSPHCSGEEKAAKYLRAYCGIESRVELDHSAYAARMYEQLKSEFIEWQNL